MLYRKFRECLKNPRETRTTTIKTTIGEKAIDSPEFLFRDDVAEASKSIYRFQITGHVKTCIPIIIIEDSLTFDKIIF